MKNVKEEALLWVRVVSPIAIWAIILYATDTKLSINKEAIKKLPDVVTVYVILSLVFTKWLWRLRFFRSWLVPFPDLQGTWEGQVTSTWKNPNTNETLSPIPIILVIRQTFSSISCTLFTKESESHSTSAQFSRDEDGAVRLSYIYTNRPKATIRDRSEIHEGAARLNVVTVPQRSLEGEFWTGRCTTGEMSLNFKSKELFESFPNA